MAMSDQGNVSCSTILKVLADETRLAVVQLLMTGQRHVGEINSELDIEQSLLSHHLKVLRDAGLVVAERDGKSVLYRLAPEVEAVRKGRGLQLGCCSLVFEE